MFNFYTMVKTWSPYGFAWQDDPISLVPLHSRGVDRDWMKQASAQLFEQEFRDIKLEPKHALIHVAPVAAYELWNGNVNGDGFPKLACQKYHHTFKTHGRQYREHANKDASIGFGAPVATAYNDRMGRIETLFDIDGTTKLGHAMIEKLASGVSIDHSMSCRVPMDRCTECGNLATSPKGPCDKAANVPSPGYCDHAKNHLGQILKNGHRVIVQNDDPTFFDQSWVDNGAEPLAITMNFRKAASGGLYVPYEKSGAGMAEALGLWAPLYKTASLPNLFLAKLALAKKLAEMEKEIPAQAQLYANVAPGAPEDDDDDPAENQLTGETNDAGAVFKALRKKKAQMSLRSFAALTGETSPEAVKFACAQLPTLFLVLEKDGLLSDTANNGTYDAPSGPISTKVAALADRVADRLSLDEGRVRNRLLKLQDRRGEKLSKQAASSSSEGVSPEILGASGSLLRGYAAYLLSELATIEGEKKASDLQVALTAIRRQVG
jgi:hypothetical protein